MVPHAQMIDHRPGIALGRVAGGLVRHGHGQDVFRPQGRGGQKGDHAGIDAAGKAHHGPLEPARRISVRMKRVRMAVTSSAWIERLLARSLAAVVSSHSGSA